MNLSKFQTFWWLTYKLFSDPELRTSKSRKCMFTSPYSILKVFFPVWRNHGTNHLFRQKLRTGWKLDGKRKLNKIFFLIYYPCHKNLQQLHLLGFWKVEEHHNHYHPKRYKDPFASEQLSFISLVNKNVFEKLPKLSILKLVNNIIKKVTQSLNCSQCKNALNIGNIMKLFQFSFSRHFVRLILTFQM